MADCSKSNVETMNKSEREKFHPESLAETSEESANGA
jgi:hypothetical protein